jgi:hypothetical protein
VRARAQQLTSRSTSSGSFSASGGDPALSARAWQTGEYGFPGKDLWSNSTLPAGTKLEVLNPGISGYATPDGTAASLGHDGTQINQGVQVGGRPFDLANPAAHSYRPTAVTLRLNTDVNAATSITRANPQYGAGGRWPGDRTPQPKPAR